MERRRIIPIFLIVFVNMLGASMVIPTLPLYAQDRFGASPQQVAFLITSFFAAQFVASPFIGRLSDRYGRVPVLIISQVGTALSFVMMSFAPNLGLLLASRVLDGITGGNIIVARAYVTDVATPEQRTQALGIIQAAFGGGFVIGPAVGGVLAAAFGDQVPFFAGAFITFVTVIITTILLDETITVEERLQRRKSMIRLRLREVASNQMLVITLIITFGAQFGLALLIATFALFGDAVLFADSAENTVRLGIGLLLAAFGVAQFITQLFLIQRLVKRFGERNLVSIGSLAQALSFVLLALITSPLLAASALAIFAFGQGVLMPSLQTLATETSSAELRGGILGVMQSVISLSTIIGTALGGRLFEISPTTPFFVSIAVFLLTTLGAFLAFRYRPARSKIGESSIVA